MFQLTSLKVLQMFKQISWVPKTKTTTTETEQKQKITTQTHTHNNIMPNSIKLFWKHAQFVDDTQETREFPSLHHHYHHHVCSSS